VLRAITSDDGGDTLTEPVTIDGWYMPNPYARLSSITPTVAADATRGPFHDRVYAVWPDARFGGTDIFFSYSADRGRTWTRPFVVNDNVRSPSPQDAPNHLLPSIAVNAAGVVGVAWLDRRDAADKAGWHVRFRASLDGGDTFGASVKVSKRRRVSTAVSVGRHRGRDRRRDPISRGGPLRVLISAPLHLSFLAITRRLSPIAMEPFIRIGLTIALAGIRRGRQR
jgi:hypothetical protein